MAADTDLTCQVNLWVEEEAEPSAVETSCCGCGGQKPSESEAGKAHCEAWLWFVFNHT